MCLLMTVAAGFAGRSGEGDFVSGESAGFESSGDADGTNDNSLAVTLAVGEDSTDNDFYDFAPITVAGSVIEDTNGNGAADPGEPGIPGATVTLYDDNGNPVDTAVTDPNGGQTSDV